MPGRRFRCATAGAPAIRPSAPGRMKGGREHAGASAPTAGNSRILSRRSLCFEGTISRAKHPQFVASRDGAVARPGSDRFSARAHCAGGRCDRRAGIEVARGRLASRSYGETARENLADSTACAMQRDASANSENGSGNSVPGIRLFGAPGWDRTSNPCLRSFIRAPQSLINQCLAQLATRKTKASQGQSRLSKPIQTVISL